MQNDSIRSIAHGDCHPPARPSFSDRIALHAGTDRANDRFGPPTVLRMLHEALGEERECVERCKRNHYEYMMMATRVDSRDLAARCLEHGAQEQSHVDQLSERIRELGGDPGHP